jgi:hypothetical protein
MEIEIIQEAKVAKDISANCCSSDIWAVDPVEL